MKVVVTGGAGFIGAHVCRALLAPGDDVEVVVVDDLSTGYLHNIDGLDTTFHHGSITDPELLDTAFEGAASVVHLAARPSVPLSIDDPLATHVANATGTVLVLEAARRAGIRHLVVASSSSVYGANPTLPKSEDLVTVPMSPYAASKLATEAYAFAYQASYGLRVLVFRFFNVFGPLQRADHAYAAVVPAFLSAALSSQPVRVFGTGQQSRDFTYVATVAEVIRQAVARQVAHSGPVNLAYGTRTDLLSLIRVISDIVGHALDVQIEPPRRGDVVHSQAEGTQVRSLFPQVTPLALEDGVRETAEWMRMLSRQL